MTAPNAFGVTADMVRQDYLPHSAQFTATSTPTLTSVTRQINHSAGYLQSLLEDKLVDTNSITDVTSAAYYWCQAYIELRVAVRLIRVMSGLDPEVTKAWVDELAALEKAIEVQGAGALGPGATPIGDTEANGPFDYISEYGVSVGDTTLASSAEPYLRRDDDL